jgi:hypothetical protein
MGESSMRLHESPQLALANQFTGPLSSWQAPQEKAGSERDFGSFDHHGQVPRFLAITSQRLLDEDGLAGTGCDRDEIGVRARHRIDDHNVGRVHRDPRVIDNHLRRQRSDQLEVRIPGGTHNEQRVFLDHSKVIAHMHMREAEHSHTEPRHTTSLPKRPVTGGGPMIRPFLAVPDQPTSSVANYFMKRLRAAVPARRISA